MRSSTRASPDTLQLAASRTLLQWSRSPLNLDPDFNLDPEFQGFRQDLPVTVNPGGGLPANSIQFGFNTGFKLGDSFIYQGLGRSAA